MKCKPISMKLGLILTGFGVEFQPMFKVGTQLASNFERNIPNTNQFSRTNLKNSTQNQTNQDSVEANHQITKSLNQRSLTSIRYLWRWKMECTVPWFYEYFNTLTTKFNTATNLRGKNLQTEAKNHHQHPSPVFVPLEIRSPIWNLTVNILHLKHKWPALLLPH